LEADLGAARSGVGKPWLKYALIALGSLADLVLILALGAFALIYPTIRRVPEADFPPPRTEAEANLRDLEYLCLYGVYARSFGPEALGAFRAAVDGLAACADTLDPAALEMEISRAVALADGAHSNVRGAGFGLSLNSAPLRLVRFSEGVFVVAADPALADLVGAQVISVEGRSPDALAEALAPYVGGPESFERERALHFMVSPEALHAAGFAAGNGELRFLFRGAGGAEFERTVTAAAMPANGPPPTTIGAMAAGFRKSAPASS
jgi:hypothetical protein